MQSNDKESCPGNPEHSTSCTIYNQSYTTSTCHANSRNSHTCAVKGVPYPADPLHRETRTRDQALTWVEVGAGDGAVHLCMGRAHQAGEGADGLPSSRALRQLLHSRQ
jgi:hypothetical protein